MVAAAIWDVEGSPFSEGVSEALMTCVCVLVGRLVAGGVGQSLGRNLS